MSKPALRLRTAFTLVELLVVIAIIGILVALLLPAVQSAREAARRMQCSNNLKQISLAVLNYESSFKSLPPGGVTEGRCCQTKSGITWTISILPYLEQQALFDQYDSEAANEDAVNAPVREARVATYLCPSDQETEQVEVPAVLDPTGGQEIKYHRGSYRACAGRNNGQGSWWDVGLSASGSFDLPADTRGAMYIIGGHDHGTVAMRDIRDGTTNTLLVGEHATKSPVGRRTFWARSFAAFNKSSVKADSRTLVGDFQTCIDLGGGQACKRGWGSFHPGGLHFAIADGSVRFIGDTVDMNLLADLATIAGNEIAQLP